MPQLPPIHSREFSDEERRTIAAYLLQKRAGTLQAKQSLEKGLLVPTEGWADGTLAYYIHAESYSRFLLYWVGYPVQRNQGWKPEG